MTTFEKSADLIGRILIGSIFVHAGLSKIGTYAATQAYMSSAGVPGALLPVVIAVEALGGIALILGYRTRIVALAIAAFTLLAGFFFHRAPDPVQQVMFMKNLAIAGGLLILFARGAGPWSLDTRKAGLTLPGDGLRNS